MQRVEVKRVNKKSMQDIYKEKKNISRMLSRSGVRVININENTPDKNSGKKSNKEFYHNQKI